MKKKLIAALTSAAMVATMVPATAFATTADADVTPNAGVEQKGEMKSSDLETAKASWDKAWGAIKTLNPDTMTYVPGVNTDIETASSAYSTLADKGGKDYVSSEDLTKFKSILEKQWDLRLEKVAEAQTPVNSAITENEIEKVNEFKTACSEFLDVKNKTSYWVLQWLGLNSEITALDNKTSETNALIQDLDKVVPVVTAIANIKKATKDTYETSESTKLTDLESILNNQYGKLSDSQQKKVGNYSTLTDAIQNVKNLKLDVDSVNQAVGKLPTNSSSWTFGDVSEYRETFE